MPMTKAVADAMIVNLQAAVNNIRCPLEKGSCNAGCINYDLPNNEYDVSGSWCRYFDRYIQ